MVFALIACNDNTPVSTPPATTPDNTQSQNTPDNTQPQETPPPTDNGNGENEDADFDNNEIDFSKFPRQNGEWALFINGIETDVSVVLDDTGERKWRYIALEETGSFFGIDVKYRDFEGDLIVDLFYNGEGIGYLVDGLPGGRIEIDGIIYVTYDFLIQFFNVHHQTSIYHRTDLKRKILFLDEHEVQWTLYIDDSPTDYEVIMTSDISNVDVLSYEHVATELVLNDLYVTSFIDILISTDIFEFVLAPREGAPRFHEVHKNGVWIYTVPDMDNYQTENIQPIIVFAGIGFTIDIDLGHNNVHIFNSQ